MRRGLGALLAAVAVVAAGGAAAALEVRIVFDAAAGEQPEGHLLVESLDRRQPDESPEVQRLPIAGATLFHLGDSPAPRRLRVVVPGWWARDEVVGPAGEQAGFRLVPTGRVRGRLAPTAAGAAPPAELTASFAAGRSAGPSLPGSEIGCLLAEDLSFRCEVPGGRRDLRLSASGFAPVYLWDLAVPPRKEVEVGRLMLVLGGSISGFVAAPEGFPAPEVELIPGAEHRSHVPRPGVQQPRRQSAGQQGFFQFTDLAPGTYTLVAKAPGLVAAREDLVRVLEGRESRLPLPLQLDVPVELQVIVQPPQTPKGDAWRVELMPAEPRPDAGRESSTDPSGAARLPPVPPGPYTLTVAGDGGRWWIGEVQVEHRGAPIPVELALVSVEGDVTWRDEPVRLQLVFTRERRQVSLLSDAAGRFEGLLPEPGEWNLAFRLHPHGALQTLEPVTLDAGAEPTRLELRVPDTRLQGEVVSAGGEGVAGASVRVWNLDRRSPPGSTHTNRDGRFLYQGLRPGEHVVTVLGDGTSQQVRTRVEEGEVAEVLVELEGVRRLEGRVLTALGAAPGALVLALPRTAPPRQVAVGQATTDLAGRFRLEVPADARAVDLLVLPPGAAARLVRLPFPLPQPVQVEAGDLAGELAIEGPSAGLLASLVLHHGDASFPVEPFRWWEALHGTRPTAGRRVLPRLAAGRYRVCAGTTCHDVVLGPGERRTVRFEPPGEGSPATPGATP